MDRIIITGVDGNFGSVAAKSIMGKVPKEALIFTAPKEEALKVYRDQGIETRKADFNDPEGMVDAFKGGKVILLISMPFVGEKRRNAHKRVVDAAVEAGVDKIVYTSIVGSGDDTCDSYEKFDHQYTENYIMSTDLKYVFLRDAQYAEAMISAYEEAANSTGVLSNNMGDGRMAHVSRNDCAKAAAAVAAGAGEDNVVYYITGPTANTMEEFVKVGNEVTGNNVVYEYVSDEDNYAFFDSLGVPRRTDGEWAEAASAFPFCSEGMVTFGAAIRNDKMSYCTNDFEMLTGEKPKSIREMFENIEEYRVGARTSTD